MIVKKGKRINIEIEIMVPQDVEEDRLSEWINMELNYSGYMKSGNPLQYYDLIALDIFYDISSQDVDDDDLEELKEIYE